MKKLRYNINTMHIRTAIYAIYMLPGKLYRSRTTRLCVVLIVLFYATSILSASLLPDPLFNVPYSKENINKQGKLVSATIAKDKQWRFVYSEKVPEKYKTALLTFEDKRFYFHPGFDPLAILRAAYLNIKHGKVISGASTISMQVMRMARGNRERTICQKIIELFFCVGLEFTYSKKEILAHYTTHAPFGGNIRGLRTASWWYFSKRAEDLNWSESALLAVLPNSPNSIHPGKNRDLLKQKRDRLLGTLLEKGHISKLEYELALVKQIPGKPQVRPGTGPNLRNILAKQHSKKNRSYIMSKITQGQTGTKIQYRQSQ